MDLSVENLEGIIQRHGRDGVGPCFSDEAQIALVARVKELEGERDVLKADLATARRENAKHKEWYLDSEARLYGIREERDTLRTRRETLSGLLRELADHIVMNMGMCPGAKDYDDCQCDACCRARAAESGRGSE